MGLNWVLVLRAQQLVMALVVLGLSAYVVNWYTVDTRMAAPSQVSFLVALPVLSLVSLAYTEGTSRFAPRLYVPYAAVAIDAANAVMYFGGFIALAVFLNRLIFCRGSVCGAARASTAFSAFSFCAWAASAVLLALSVRGGLRKPARRNQAAYAAEMKDAASRT